MQKEQNDTPDEVMKCGRVPFSDHRDEPDKTKGSSRAQDDHWISLWQVGFTLGSPTAAFRESESLDRNLRSPPHYSPVCSLSPSKSVSEDATLAVEGYGRTPILINQALTDRGIRKFPMPGPAPTSIIVPEPAGRKLICPHFVQIVRVCPFLGPSLTGFGSPTRAPQCMQLLLWLFIQFPPNSSLICDPCPLNNDAGAPSPIFRRVHPFGTAWRGSHPYLRRGISRGRRASHLRSWQ